MSPKAAKSVLGLGILTFVLVFPYSIMAQGSAATLSGTVAAPSGGVIPNAKVTIKNVATAQSMETHTNSAGYYALSNLAPGVYRLSVTAEGYSAETMQVTIAPGVNSTTDVKLYQGLSLGELGFTPAQIQGNAQLQARLNKRSHMLKMHQRLGLITTGPLVATVILGAFAGGHSPSSTDRNVHAALGSVTAGLYFASAYYAIFAPKIPGTQTRGPIRLHKALAWIHGPGMILTPILGIMAYDQLSRGERVHGIASAHGAVAIATLAAYGASILSVVSKKF